MLTIDINHPDVLDFIKIKRDLTKVTGANISVRLNNEFMKAVEGDKDYILRFPCNISSTPNPETFNKYEELIEGDEPKTYYKKVKAKEVWDELIKSARDFAEPGLLFWDNALDYDPAAVYEEYKPISTNPLAN